MPTSGEIYSLFQENYEIAVDGLMLASSEAEVKQIAEYYLRISPLESKTDYNSRMSLSAIGISPTEE